MISDNERIAIIRTRTLDRKAPRRTCNAAQISNETRLRALMESSGKGSWQLRNGLCTKAILASCVFEMDELELLAGRPSPTPAQIPINSLDEKLIQFAAEHPTGGQRGHCQLNMAPLLTLGIGGFISDLRKRFSCLDGLEKKDTIESFILALEGLSAMILNAGKAVETAMVNASSERKIELTETVESCRRIATEPPETFMDGLHLLWFPCMALEYANESGLVVLGHIDRLLIGLYQNDLKSGLLTKEKALLLLDNLYLNINDFIADGLATSVMVGGRDRNNNDLTNELSYLCLEALRRSNLCYPTVGVCWHKNTPEKLTDLAVELIAKGYTTPAFFGDETIRQGLESYGASPEDACNYINSTCVEITPVGASNIWVASPYFSLCKILLEEIDAQAERDPDSRNFAGFVESYFKRLSAKIDAAAREQNKLRELRFKNDVKPLQSVLTLDCVERAKDINRGGARYNWVECSFVGIANLADAMLVIKREVFDGEISFSELKKVLGANFKGYNNLLQKILNVHPKYGTANAEVDEIVNLIVKRLAKECEKHKMLPDHSHFVPGAFCWIMHERLGRECGATPDGRMAGVPFADGAGPAQGRESHGPTACVLSTSSWDHTCMMGGTALNMKFSSDLFKDDKGGDSLKALIKTYLERGGIEVQVNVVNNETLLKAKADPIQYRDLVVRIGGYTDYFTHLSRGMQDEVIQRTSFQEI